MKNAEVPTFNITSFMEDFPSERIDQKELPEIPFGETIGETFLNLLNQVSENFNLGKEGMDSNRALNRNIGYVFDEVEKKFGQPGLHDFLSTLATKLKSLNLGNYGKLTPKTYKGYGLQSIIDSYDVETGFKYIGHAISMYSSLTVNKSTIVEAVA